MSTDSEKPDIRFIHLADTHLGLNWPAIGRREKIQIPVYGKAFSSIIDTAIEQQVDFVIHAGDLVNQPRPPTAAWNRLLQELPRLKENGIPFIITVGSHDKPESYFDKAGGDVLQLLDTRLGLIKRVELDQQPFFSLKTAKGLTVTFYGLGDHRREQEQCLIELRKQMNRESDFNILIMHGSISSMPQMIGHAVKTETIDELLSQKFVDYIALGHYHKKWEHKDLHIYNPGSPEYTSFADAPTVSYSYDGSALKQEAYENPEHGYYIVEVKGEIIKARFETLTKRDVKNIEVRFNEATASQVTEGTKSAITQHMSESSIIRPILRGKLNSSASRSEIDLQEIFSLREKLLYLEYPLIDLNTTQVQLEAADGSDLQNLLHQYYKAKLGDHAEETTNIAIKLVETYTSKSKTTHQEALTIIDGWEHHD